jgi:hypothetical protein
MIHLMDEVRMADLRVLKYLVRQKAKPEGSMSEEYLLQEALGMHHNIIGYLDEYAPSI